ncbi:hypothetical protein [Streptomyces alkaliterrae]|uniref:Pyridoxamine 5'-phosphate oxidase family protein n=1 Tax=Streptomyces alkaliterrae TaxID=2213162 RepID=A0A5P0YQ25_9ACTN|nr:hypothetical protein [Streptomyces alkaliterrae]MBB1255143.1 hypothetical protein [Streptomyces alkaliterrae]MBB1261357.1 hypothetical protein [Streptomyces alkaliterrae]MQS02358.1 hypothetical protein [Streptomyces alkaliterrae]
MTETAAQPLFSQALIEESAKKSALVWVRGARGPARALWHAWHDGAVCVVTGPGEQPVDGLELVDGGTATVTARSKDKGGRLVVWPARVVELAPGGEAWTAAAEELKAKRLNAPDTATLTERWAAECRVLRLEPSGAPSQEPGAMPRESTDAAPLPTPATTRRAQPQALPRLLRAAARRRSGR